MKKIGFGVMAIFAVLLGLTIGTLNPNSVTLDLLWFQLDWPLGLLLLFALVIGLLLGLLFGEAFRVLPLKLRLRRQGGQTGTPPDQSLVGPDD